MKRNRLFQWSIVAALAGFIFGFDTVVISGANLPIRELWHTSPLFHGFFIMSIALWGTLLGSIFGGIPTERFGRKKVLFWIGVLFTLSALGSALAPTPYIFSFFRFIGGIAIGVSSVVAPTYISEISTRDTRGKLGALYQFNIVFGILIAFLSNYFLQGVGGAEDWRWMLAVLAAPSLIYTVMVTSLPESPRWLERKRNDVENVTFFSRRHKTSIWLAFLIAFFNQLSGINFILYYVPEILPKIGFGAKDSLLNSVAIGSSNLIFTFLGLYLIDRLGRRNLLLIGSIGYILSLAMVAVCFAFHAGAVWLMLFLLLFIAAHAVGQGAVIWVFISEIFPDKVRAAGQSFGASVHWVFAALITLVTPFFLDAKSGVFADNPWPIFAFFAGVMVIQLIWVITRMPETKGISLEQIEQKLTNS